MKDVVWKDTVLGSLVLVSTMSRFAVGRGGGGGVIRAAVLGCGGEDCCVEGYSVRECGVEACRVGIFYVVGCYGKGYGVGGCGVKLLC